MKSKGIYRSDIMRELEKTYKFGYAKYEQLCDLYGRPLNNPQTGIDNPMYGKSPSKLAGIGTKCHLVMNDKKIFCRSSLELKIYCYLYMNNVDFSLSSHRVKYIYNKRERTYNPDIVIDNCIYEIKPSKLIELDLNVEKFKSLQQYCDKFNLKCKYITEKTYDISFFNLSYLDKLLTNNEIIIDQKNLEKLKKYL